MIPRYSLPEMAALFTDEARFALWLEVEVLATEAWATLGVVPEEDAKAVRERAPAVDGRFVAAVNEREQVTDHDVAAFVDVVQAAIGGDAGLRGPNAAAGLRGPNAAAGLRGPNAAAGLRGPNAGAWVHYGLTSSDVVDTALSATLTRAADLLIAASGRLVAALKRRAFEFRDTPMAGRTHGMHAEPTTFGVKLAHWCLQADRDRQRLRAARDAVAVGKLSGAVGTYSNIDPEVERHVCAALGLRPVPATQVIARDRHAEYLWACAAVGATVEMVATEIRHLQRTEVGEVAEPFRTGQKGSSAMPHKRNPVTAERLTGLARVLRGNLGAGLENVALWHERDISHSSVERVILPDSSLLAYYLLVRLQSLVEGMTVDADRMLENLDRSLGLVFSQPVLLALVAGGLSRDDAYRVVQDDAARAWSQRRPFRTVLAEDPRVPLTGAQLDEAFSLPRALRNTGPIFDALDEVADA